MEKTICFAGETTKVDIEKHKQEVADIMRGKKVYEVRAYIIYPVRTLVVSTGEEEDIARIVRENETAIWNDFGGEGAQITLESKKEIQSMSEIHHELGYMHTEADDLTPYGDEHTSALSLVDLFIDDFTVG